MLQCFKNAVGFDVLPNMTVPSMCLHIGRLKRIDLFTHDMLNNSHCPQVPRARHLWTSVLLAIAPKVWMHKTDIPGLRVVRIGETQSLSTGALREAPVDN